MDEPSIQYVSSFKWMLWEVLFFAESTLLYSFSVGAVASCNYIPQIMLNNIFYLNKQ